MNSRARVSFEEKIDLALWKNSICYTLKTPCIKFVKTMPALPLQLVYRDVVHRVTLGTRWTMSQQAH
ncbi:hypothetical protein ACO1Y2_27035, partial [Klebsiella quasipneumoniae subsp. similipneumoniae]|uniref:hypothetical protein n=1 Tax=Klebsiella quasipneumoniae TaxID=1463165 RepID=UPI003BF70B42